MKNMSKIVLNLRKTWARARAWFHACPDGEGWVWRRTSRWRMWQARLSHRSRGLRLSRDCHEIVTSEIVTRLSQDCHKRDCHAVVEAWDCHKIVTSEIVTRLSQDCHKRDYHAVVEAWEDLVGLHITPAVWRSVLVIGGNLGEASQMVGQIFTTAIQQTRKKGHFLYVKKSWQCLPDTSSYCIDKKENTAAHLSRGAFLKLAAYSLQSPVEHFGSNKRFNI